MKRLIPLLLCGLVLGGCSLLPAATASLPEPLPTFTALPSETAMPPERPTEPQTEPPTEPPVDPLEELLAGMTAEEKAGQVLLAQCPDADAALVIAQYHLGGVLLFGRDFEGETPDSVRKTIQTYQNYAKIPLLIAVDEEGGTVCRVSGKPGFRDSRFPSPRKLYAEEGLVGLMDTEAEKCDLLSGLGINLNLAPVCDITENRGSFLYDRSLGLSPEETAMVIRAMVTVMVNENMGCALKHFPGYGENGDTHTGIAVDERSIETFYSRDFLPFVAGIKAGAGGVLVSHNTVLCMDETYPASLSPEVHRILREELGFEGVAITDDLTMSAISGQFGAEEAVILALNAGNDLLCCSDYETAYRAILRGLEEGTIPVERLDEAVLRVLRWKQSLGILPLAQIEE